MKKPTDAPGFGERDEGPLTAWKNAFQCPCRSVAVARPVVCPFCKSKIQPLVGADGRKTCPLCRNTGKPLATPLPPVAPPPVRQPAPPVQQPVPVPPTKPNAPGAVASLVLGIIGIVTGFLGIILGIVAIVLGNKAERAIANNPGAYEGGGLATAGRILGIISIVLGALTLIVMVFIVVLFANIAGALAPDITFVVDAATNQVIVNETESGLEWEDFTVTGSADCVLPSGSVDVGDVVQCAGDGSVRIAYFLSDDEVFTGTV